MHGVRRSHTPRSHRGGRWDRLVTVAPLALGSWLSHCAHLLAQSAGLATPATACFSVWLTTKRTTRRAGIAAARVYS